MSFRSKFFLLSTVLTCTLSCQFEDGSINGSDKIYDSVEYAVKTRSKEIGNCESLQSPCAKIKIQTLDIKSGVSDPTAVNIELDIEREILLIEGEEALKAKNIDELVDLLVEEYKNLISDLKDYNLPWEIMYMLEVVNNGRGLLSVVLNSYSYRGGAHGISFVRYLNYNLHNGNRITLDSAFVKDDDFVKLCEMSFRSQNGIDERADINEVRFNFPDNRFYVPDNFIINRENVVFKYDVYEIAPYSEGAIEFKVNLESLRPYIKSDVLKAFVSEAASI